MEHFIERLSLVAPPKTCQDRKIKDIGNKKFMCTWTSNASFWKCNYAVRVDDILYYKIIIFSRRWILRVPLSVLSMVNAMTTF